MGDVIPNGPTASNKARVGLSKEENARFFGPPPLIAGEDQARCRAAPDYAGGGLEIDERHRAIC